MSKVAYAELQCTSNFSFLRGASHPEEIAMQAKHLGVAAIAVTDRNTLAGVVRAHAAAKDAELPFIVGVRLDLFEPGISFLAYPTNRQAYGALCRLLSMGQRRAEKGQCLITLDDVYAHAPGMIFALLAEGADHLPELRRRLKAPLYLALSHQYRGDDRERFGLGLVQEIERQHLVPRIAERGGHHAHPERVDRIGRGGGVRGDQDDFHAGDAGVFHPRLRAGRTRL